MKEITMQLDRQTLPEQVADKIEKLIAESELSPGDRLSSERAFAARLGVGRPVVREAIKILTVRCLVEIKPGSGVYIKKLAPGDLVESLSRGLRFCEIPDRVAKMRELRALLEPGVAELAAERAGVEDVSELEKLVTAMEEAVDDWEAWLELDIRFHLRVAEATGNELFRVLLESVSGMLREYMGDFAQNLSEESFPRLLAIHRDIVEKIKTKDSQGARDAMRRHVAPK